MVVGSRRELVERFPELDPLEVGLAPAAAVVVPLTAGLERLGVLHLAWSEPQPTVEEQTSFLGILGIQGGQALARVRTFEREHEIALAGGMGGIDDHGQVREPLEDRDGTQIQRLARRGLERADAMFTQQHLLIAARQDELGGVQQLFE